MKSKIKKRKEKCTGIDRGSKNELYSCRKHLYYQTLQLSHIHLILPQGSLKTHPCPEEEDWTPSHACPTLWNTHGLWTYHTPGLVSLCPTPILGLSCRGGGGPVALTTNLSISRWLLFSYISLHCQHQNRWTVGPGNTLYAQRGHCWVVMCMWRSDVNPNSCSQVLFTGFFCFILFCFEMVSFPGLELTKCARGCPANLTA